MINTEKNLPHGGNREAGKTETGTTCEAASLPKNDFITSSIGCLQISDFLLHGAENALPRRYLETVTGLDGRTIRAMIARERLRGVPILSDNAHGYFLPADDAEKVRFVRSMRRRASEILRAADAVEKAGR